MEALTTIWKYSTKLSKWLRVTDVTNSTANDKLMNLKMANPNEIYKISEKKPTKLKN